jgi:hypothetical protein
MKHATTEGDWWRILQGVGDARRGRANIDLDKVRPHLVKYGAPASSFQGILNHYMGR